MMGGGVANYMTFSLPIQLITEYFGTLLLLIIVTGSGYMGQSLAMGNNAVTLLANSIATGCGLFVLIRLLGPISGAHFNPIVTCMFYFFKEINFTKMIGFIVVQIFGAICGVLLTHIMFSLPVFELSETIRSNSGLWISEYISGIVLLSVILLSIKFAKEQVASIVALTVTAGYWFTSSTFFANPAVTIARTFTNTFVGIHFNSVGMFCISQCLACLTIVIIAKCIKR